MIKKISELYKEILMRETSPLFAIFSFICFAVLVLYFILKNQLVAFILICGGSIFFLTFLIIVYYYTKKERRRFSDLVETPNYDYKVKLTKLEWKILDCDGKNAKLEKRKVFVALEPIDEIKEYTWGDGTPPRKSDFDVGEQFSVLDIYRQGSKFVIPIKLDKKYYRGDQVELFYFKKISNGFPADVEFVETIITTNTDKFKMSVEIPADRPVNSCVAIQRHGDTARLFELGENGFHKIITSEGNTKLIWELDCPYQRDIYTIEWDWTINKEKQLSLFVDKKAG